MQRAHSSTAVPLAGCGTSLSPVIVAFLCTLDRLCPWVARAAFMPVCSTGGASAGATRAAAAQRQCAPSEAAGGPHNRHKNHAYARREHDDSIDVTTHRVYGTTVEIACRDFHFAGVQSNVSI